LAVSVFSARFNLAGSHSRHKQLDSNWNSSWSVASTSFTKRGRTDSGKAIMLTVPIHRTPMMMFSARLEIMSKAKTGVNAAGIPTMAVVYPDSTQAYAQWPRS
jgi:hypothetical protein